MLGLKGSERCETTRGLECSLPLPLCEERSSEKFRNLGKNTPQTPQAQSSWLLRDTCYIITDIFRALVRAAGGEVIPPGKYESKWTHSKIHTDHRYGL